VKTPLILAVERDPQQAAHLASMFKRQFSAELVLVTSASAALKRLAGRVPELVLTSALIRPKDEIELVNWLRDLGAAAAHVQTVTIPVLAAPDGPSGKKAGGLGFGRDREVACMPDTCDPAVFADWISVYLDLASNHRAESGSKGSNP
jgi:CheY-like chemotaxis protein